MKPITHLLCIALLAVCPGLLLADDPVDDPIQTYWIPPELLMQHPDEIGLTDQQIQSIRSRVEEAGPIARQHQARLDDAMGKLAQLLLVAEVDEEAALKAGLVGSPGVKYTNAPISIAFIESCRPGWTTYPVGPLRDNFRVLYEELAAHDNPHWASTEASPRGLRPGGLSMREYLGWHFDFGATVVLFNTGATSPELSGRLNDAVWGEDAIGAYRDFLSPKN